MLRRLFFLLMLAFRRCFRTQMDFEFIFLSNRCWSVCFYHLSILCLYINGARYISVKALLSSQVSSLRDGLALT